MKIRSVVHRIIQANTGTQSCEIIYEHVNNIKNHTTYI